MQDPTTYTEAADILGSSSARKIAHNTKLERLDAERIGVRLHSTACALDPDLTAIACEDLDAEEVQP
jgi:hypothetical protein